MRTKEFRNQINAIKKATPKTAKQEENDAQKTQGAGSQ